MLGLTGPPPRRRPGRLWLLFWGRKRRGFPGLLAALLGLLLALALLFGFPGAAAFSRYWLLVSIGLLLLLIAASLALVVVTAIRPPRRPGERRGRR